VVNTRLTSLRISALTRSQTAGAFGHGQDGEESAGEHSRVTHRFQELTGLDLVLVQPGELLAGLVPLATALG